MRGQTAGKPVKPAVLLLALISTIYAQYNPNGDVRGPPPPSLDTFSNYEDMQTYIANRNFRSLRLLDNPTDDSYISAFNQYNEQPANGRQKRYAHQRALPNAPILLKFEVSDAVEPSEEVKNLIRDHRSRELKLSPLPPTLNGTQGLQDSRKQEEQTKKVSLAKKTYSKNRSNSKSNKRTKRSAGARPNFHIQMIKFEESDAREPDERTKELIKRMRSMDVERSKHVSTPPTDATVRNSNQLHNKAPSALPNPSVRPSTRSKNPKLQVMSKRKRVRRSAPKTPPKMIKFQLEDAKDPDDSIKFLMQQKQVREGRNIQMQSAEQNSTHTQTADAKKDGPGDASASDGPETDDQSNNESKRMYIFKEAPVVKIKKSVNSLPHEVQKIISNIMKDNNGAKAYVKYIPQQQLNYGYLKSKAGQPLYNAKMIPATFMKYIQPQKADQVHMQIHSVPVVEKVRYIYHPVPVSAVSGHSQKLQALSAHAQIQQHHYIPAPFKLSQAAMAHPIVVPEAAAGHGYAHASNQQQQAPVEIHHTYAADLSQLHDNDNVGGQSANEVPVAHFRPSKPDPNLQENKLEDGGLSGLNQGYEDGSASHPVEHYNYELYQPSVQESGGGEHEQAQRQQQADYQKDSSAEQAAPIIKIEYHAPPDPLRDNYKELNEFKELSALMGKSPEDQIHGLTYLLAKEMQNKLQLQRQQKQLAADALLHRPQDNTSPILFHPADGQLTSSQQQQQQGYSNFKTHSGTLIGMGKSKLYVPIVEQSIAGIASEESKVAAAGNYAAEQGANVKLVAQVPIPSSYLNHGFADDHVGANDQNKLAVQQVIHHPKAVHPGYLSLGGHEGLQAGVENNKAALGAGFKQTATVKDGHGLQFDNEQTLQYASKYAFGYRIRDFYTGNDFGHKQNRDLDGVTRGQYHILLPDGRIQNVIYHADDTGFHADVSFESGH